MCLYSVELHLNANCTIFATKLFNCAILTFVQQVSGQSSLRVASCRTGVMKSSVRLPEIEACESVERAAKAHNLLFIDF